MSSNRIIAKLITNQVAHLQEGEQAVVSFLVKPTKKWQRGRFAEVTLTFRVDPGGDLLKIEYDYAGPDGTISSTPIERGSHDHVEKTLANHTIVDVKGSGLMITADHSRPNSVTK